MNLYIGSDHAGYRLKESLVKQIEQRMDIDIIDFGTDSEKSVDYPDIIRRVAEAVQQNQHSKGLIICGSGNGAAITANRYSGIRAAVCWSIVLAKLAREHNDANILSLPARFVEPEDAEKMVEVFLKTQFEGGRHKRRIDKIDAV
ncbi:MAG: ribose 5-phosphate isomerase B [Flavobacteriaceae bacterium]|nr:ribose 5-phosphate isomerase B [Flavobacteriaceae bacterium]